MRLFFAFDLDAASKTAIADWRDRHARVDGRAVAPGNFHITLAFLGELDAGRLERLCDAADAWFAASPQAPGSVVQGASVLRPALRLDQLGYWARPGICWLGSTAQRPDLVALAAGLARVGERVGAARDRRSFLPHVTLYRSCRVPPPEPIVPADIPVTLDAITLFQTVAGRRGVHYQAVTSWQA